MTDIDQDHRLLKELGKLPRAIRPQNDVWPAIAQRLGQQEPAAESAGHGFRWWPQALAASVALAFVLGMLAGREWIPMPGDSEQAMAPGSRLAWTTDMAGGLATSEIEYQAAFREFISVGQPSGRLLPQTVEFIERGWSDLRDTEAAIIVALEEHPDDPFLNSKMLGLRHKQLDFLKQVAALEHSSRRITI